MQFRSLILTAAGILAIGTPPATARVIDSFESGPVSLSATTPGDSTVVANPSPGHCIAAERAVYLEYADGAIGTMSCVLSPLANNDDAIMVTFPLGPVSFVRLGYQLANPVDLTVGGSQFTVRVVGGGPTSVEITLYAVGPGLTLASRFLSGPGTYIFDFAEFNTPLKNVEELGVFLEAAGGTWGIQDISTSVRLEKLYRWDIRDILVLVSQFSGPGVHSWDGLVSEIAGSSPFPGSSLSVNASGPGYSGMHLYGSDSGGGNGLFGETSNVAVHWDGASFTQGAFDLVVKPNDDVNYGTFLLGAPQVEILPQAITITHSLLVSDVPGLPQGVLRQEMILTPPDGQNVSFQNVVVTPGLPGSPGPAGGYRLQFDAVGTGVDVSQPLFETYLSGGFFDPLSATSAPLIVAETTGRSLQSIPTVSRAITNLVLDRPADRRAAIDVYDVNGRLVRRLPIAVGANAVSWNGVTDRGNLAASGVYFARFLDGHDTATTRIVRVR